MRPSLLSTLPAVLLCLAATTGPALADLCAYRPGELLSDVDDSVLGDAIKSGAGFDLSDVVSGTNLLNPKRGNNRIKEVTGVVAAAISAPVSVAAGVVGITAFEGVCSLRDARRTDSEAVLEVLQSMAAEADPSYFALIDADKGAEEALLRIGDGQGGGRDYPVRDLEIKDSELRLRRLGPNRVLGQVTFRLPAETLILSDETELLEMPEAPAPLPEVEVSPLAAPGDKNRKSPPGE
ncbi:hypothetical protein [Oceanicola sp. S124]|uniref:hypothetical protein n=1 Tax=Oceanicola sp. S124 TaxID=1042378 RepID=UPI000255A186|nr:hypothetical protein [Oceanicola sp. S124]